ncbi:unnamed protein product [Cochlearia groenlandica]
MSADKDGKTIVFWDRACSWWVPFREPRNINVLVPALKSAFATKGYHGELFFRLYVNDDTNYPTDPTQENVAVYLAPEPGKSFPTLNLILLDILCTAIDYSALVPKHKINLVLVHDCPFKQPMFVRVLDALNSRGFNLVLVLTPMPCRFPIIDADWLFMIIYHHLCGEEVPFSDNDGQSQIETTFGKSEDPITTTITSTTTTVFWDEDDCPIPPHLNPSSICKNFKSALHDDNLEIKVYGVSETFSDAGLTFITKSVYHKNFTSNRWIAPDPACAHAGDMLFDILLFALDNPKGSNLVVISKNILSESLLVDVLAFLDEMKYNVLLAQPDELATRGLPFNVRSIWLWTTLAHGGNPYYKIGNKRKNIRVSVSDSDTED